MVEKILFFCQIFESEILMDLHVLRSPESENPVFSGWSVSCVYLPDISIIQKQSIAETSNLAFVSTSIHLYQM